VAQSSQDKLASSLNGIVSTQYAAATYKQNPPVRETNGFLIEEQEM
jgi:hypothetical protein